MPFEPAFQDCGDWHLQEPGYGGTNLCKDPMHQRVAVLHPKTLEMSKP